MDTLLTTGKEVIAWLAKLGVTTVAVLGVLRVVGQKWIDQQMSVRLEKFKAEQQTELERLKHRLVSRISKIHEKEFEVLPKAWLMLNDLHGSVVLALDLTMKTYPDFRQLTPEQFEEFVMAPPASRLSAVQKQELRDATDRRKYFIKAMAGIYLDDAHEKQRLFQNYLIEHRIFMNDELREKFGAAQSALLNALSNYSIGKEHDQNLVHESWKQMGNIAPIVEGVEQAVQKRLRYEEA
jgi:hypothetical protein